MEQIKVGDIVMVSKAIPQFYRRYNSMRIFEGTHKVADIEEGLALLDSIPVKYVTMLPIKYLVKVDAEAKERKYKRGQLVEMPDGDVAIITAVNYDSANPYSLLSIKEEGKSYYAWSDSGLKPYVKPQEKPNNTIAIPVEADLTDSFWSAYEADVAKEIAVRIADTECRPDTVSWYAVKVAKAVIENLKKSEE